VYRSLQPLVTRFLRSAVVAALPLLLPLCAAGANSGDNTSSLASKSLSSQFVKFSSAGLDGNIRPLSWRWSFALHGH
ncbi:Os01g0150700, partial [Oryza sativa Japonica Group]